MPSGVHPTVPVRIEASKMIKQMISSFFIRLFLRATVIAGIACRKIKVRIKPSDASTVVIISPYHDKPASTETANSFTAKTEKNTEAGAYETSERSNSSKPRCKQ